MAPTALDTTLSRNGAKLPAFGGASSGWRPFALLISSQNSLEIARDRNANDGAQPAEESVPRRTDLLQLLYRFGVELRLNNEPTGFNRERLTGR
jgi:hypothetical protein